MMKLEGPTILHRKDESGAIVESRVFGPDDEVPEGFGNEGFEVIRNEVRTASVEESKLTPWESPVARQGVEVDDDSEVNDGTPIQVRAEESWTDGEKEAIKELEDRQAAEAERAEQAEDEESEVNEGSPVQAKVQAGAELTESEENPGEEKDGRKSGRRRSSGS